MNELTRHEMLHLGAYLIPALVWTIIAVELWANLLGPARRRVHGIAAGSPTKALLTAVATGMALHQILSLPFPLVPASVRDAPPIWARAWQFSAEACVLWAVTAFRHMAQHLGRECVPRSRTWLAVNYGGAALAIGAAMVMHLWGIGHGWIATVVSGFTLVWMTLALRDMSRVTEGGWWRPGSVGGARKPDLVVVVSGVAGAALWIGLCIAATPVLRIAVALDTVLPLLLAVPFAVRMLGTLVRVFLQTVVMLAAATGLVLGGQAVAARADEPWLVALVQLASVAALLVVLGPGQTWLRGVLEHVLFGRSRSRHQELHEFLHALSPAAGIRATCERAADEIVRVMQLRGAGILIDRPDGEIETGAFSLGPLRDRWPRGAAATGLPSAPYGGEQINGLPAELARTLVEAKVVSVVPIVSPRQRWGDLFIAAGPLGASFSTEDIQTLEGLACQLALVLDAAELLDRTVAAERSLAHAEKLAAIGELAARVAHEIRNPITAARSLAQQLAREPSGHQEEHEVILMELERVERQIAVLLRFARREEFRFAPVDLGVLAGHTIDDLRPRLDAASIDVRLVCEPDLVAPADGEKVRQVLINLVENAMDALGDVPAERRRLRVEAGRRNGTATIQVSDDGPGVSPEALPNLFEPFYSGKPTGTGLGLAIAKRTVDAHGGRISATSTNGAGLTIAIELPLDGVA